MRTRVEAIVRRSKMLTFFFLDCCACGVVFGMSDDLDSRRRQDGEDFYCPNGHAQSYTETNEMRLNRELQAARDDLASARSQLAKERGASARLRERIKNGVCPCCHRTFRALSRHMANQHPEYVSA